MIDIGYDVRTDSGGGDPDSRSATLRSYHRIMWSKQLPSGQPLILNEDLVAIIDNKRMAFSSDAITHTFSKWKRYQHIISQVPPEKIEDFYCLGCTVGAYIIFPREKINGLPTINMARGTHAQINDRMDLTLECIRRYYIGEESPLTKCFENYADFFELFLDFKGYINFFLLQDLVDRQYRVRYFYPFKNFGDNTLPETVEGYLEYRACVMDFITKRNERIHQHYQRK